MKNKLPRQPITFRIDTDLKKKLDELSKAKDKKVSSLINLSVHQFLDKEKVANFL